MIDGIQDLFLAIGNDGCMALCLVDIASEFTQKRLNPFEEIAKGVKNNLIFYDFKNPSHPDRMYVNNTALFLESMTGYIWTERREKELPSNSHEYYIIEKWQSKHTGKELTHFSRPLFKPLEFSQTMRYGVIKEFRLWKPLKMSMNGKQA